MKWQWQWQWQWRSLLVAGSVMFAAPPQQEPAPSAALEILTSPAGSGTAQPQIATFGERAVLSWIVQAGSRASLQFSERTADGWTAARDVASGENWFVNWADVPSVVPLAGGRLAAHWLQKSGTGTYAYDVRLSFSDDGGRSWTSSTTPHHDGTQTEHGFASLVAAPGGGLNLVWLDGRAMKPAAHDSHDGGSITLRAAAFGADGSQASESLIDDRVCECCPTAAAVTSEGPIVAYRDRSGDEVRDIHVSRFVGGQWTGARAVHADGWKINACPVNGPALSATGRDVALAWFNARDDQGRAFVAFSSDAGATFREPIRVDDRVTLGRVDVELLDAATAAVSWIEVAGDRATFMVRRITRSGSRTPAVPVAQISSNRQSGYPRMAKAGGELLFAWTSTEGGLRVQTARMAVGGR